MNYKISRIFIIALCCLSQQFFRAAEEEKKEDIHEQADVKPLSNPSDAPKPAIQWEALRQHEVYIPANGHCLYTTVLLQLLLDHSQSDKIFENYINGIAKDTELKREEFLDALNNPAYIKFLQSKAFQDVVDAFMRLLKIKPKTWGGDEEIQKMADALQIDIQEYYPQPEATEKLIKGDLVSSKTKASEKGNILPMVHIVRDKPADREVVEKRQAASLKDDGNYRHYRLLLSPKSWQTFLGHAKSEKNKVQKDLAKQANVLDNRRKVAPKRKRSPQVLVGKALLKDLHLQATSLNGPHTQKNKAAYKPKSQNKKIQKILERLLLIDKIPVMCVEKGLALLDAYLELKGVKTNEKILLPGNKLFEGKQTMFLKMFKALKQEDLPPSAYKALQEAEALIEHSVDNSAEAVKKVGIARKACQPLDIEETLFLIWKAEQSAKQIKGKDVVVFAGGTGAGKSTTIFFMLGSKMYATEENELTHIAADISALPERVKRFAQDISSSPLDRSETRYITAVPLDVNNINLDLVGKGVLLCDTPGFEDTSGAEVDISNGYGIVKALQQANRVAVIILIPHTAMYVKRMLPVRSLIYKLANMIPKFGKHKKAFKYVFTRIMPKEEENIRQKISSFVELVNKGEANLDIVSFSIFKDIEKKIKKDGPILVKPLQGDGSELVERIFDENLKFINNPAKVFKPFISSGAEKALIKQITIDKESIMAAAKAHKFAIASYKIDLLLRLNQYLKRESIEQDCKQMINMLIDIWQSQNREICNKFKAGVWSIKPLKIEDVKAYRSLCEKCQSAEAFRSKYLGKKATSYLEAVEVVKDILIKLYESLVEEKINGHVLQDKIVRMQIITQVFHEFSPLFEQAMRTIQENIDQIVQTIALDIREGRLLEAGKQLMVLHQASQQQGIFAEQAQKAYSKGTTFLQTKLHKDKINIASTLGVGKGLASSKQRSVNMLTKPTLDIIMQATKSLLEASLVFREKCPIGDLSTQIEKLLDEVLANGKAYAQGCANTITILLEQRRQNNYAKIQAFLNSVELMRQIDLFRNSTYEIYFNMKKKIDNHIEDQSAGIGEIFDQLFNIKQYDNVHTLPKAVRSLKASLAISTPNEQEALLAPLQESLRFYLKKNKKVVENLNLSLEASDRDIAYAKFILHVFLQLEEVEMHKITEIIKERQPAIQEDIERRLLSTVTTIKVNFDPQKGAMEVQKRIFDNLTIMQQEIAKWERYMKAIEEGEQKMQAAEELIATHKEALNKVEKKMAPLSLNLNKQVADYKKQFLKYESYLSKYQMVEAAGEKKESKEILKKCGCESEEQLKEKKESFTLKIKEANALFESNNQTLCLEKKTLESKIEEQKKVHAGNKKKVAQQERLKASAESTLEKCKQSLQQSGVSAEDTEALRLNPKRLQREIEQTKEKIDQGGELNASFIAKKLKPIQIKQGLAYLQAVEKLDWPTFFRDEDHPIKNIKEYIRKVRMQVNEYFKKYAENIVDETRTCLNYLLSLSVGADVKGFEKGKQERNRKIDVLHKRCKEIKKLKEKLTDLVNKHDVDLDDCWEQCQSKFINIHTQLTQQQKSIFNSEDYGIMMQQADFARELGNKLDRYIEKAGVEFGNVYIGYAKHIYSSIDQRDFKSKIENEDYVGAFQTIQNMQQRKKIVMDPSLGKQLFTIKRMTLITIKAKLDDTRRFFDMLDADAIHSHDKQGVLKKMNKAEEARHFFFPKPSKKVGKEQKEEEKKEDENPSDAAEPIFSTQQAQGLHVRYLAIYSYFTGWIGKIIKKACKKSKNQQYQEALAYAASMAKFQKNDLSKLHNMDLKIFSEGVDSIQKAVNEHIKQEREAYLKIDDLKCENNPYADKNLALLEEKIKEIQEKQEQYFNPTWSKTINDIKKKIRENFDNLMKAVFHEMELTDNRRKNYIRVIEEITQARFPEDLTKALKAQYKKNKENFEIRKKNLEETIQRALNPGSFVEQKKAYAEIKKKGDRITKMAIDRKIEANVEELLGELEKARAQSNTEAMMNKLQKIYDYQSYFGQDVRSIGPILRKAKQVIHDFLLNKSKTIAQYLKEIPNAPIEQKGKYVQDIAKAYDTVIRCKHFKESNGHLFEK